MHLGGAVVFGAVGGNQHVIAQTPERRQAIAGFKRPDRGVHPGWRAPGDTGSSIILLKTPKKLDA